MLFRQDDQSVGMFDTISTSWPKISASKLFGRPSGRETFSPPKARLRRTHLESAAFVPHISVTTPESAGHRKPRVLKPGRIMDPQVFGLPLQPKIYRRPRHAGVVDIKRVPAKKMIGSARFTVESTPF